MNAWTGPQFGRIVRHFASTRALEVLALQEVSWDLLNRLNGAGIANYLPYSVAAQQTWHDNGGVNVLYSAAPMGQLLTIWTSAAPSVSAAGSFRKRARTPAAWNTSCPAVLNSVCEGAYSSVTDAL